jgi:uncharacterized protein YrzB (UPF0473 family)
MRKDQMDNSIIFETENGEKITFYVEEETRVNGINYLLVSDSTDDSANAYILKDTSDDSDEEADYVMVEDDDEFDAVAALFEKMMEDTDILR